MNSTKPLTMSVSLKLSEWNLVVRALRLASAISQSGTFFAPDCPSAIRDLRLPDPYTARNIADKIEGK